MAMAGRSRQSGLTVDQSGYSAAGSSAASAPSTPSSPISSSSPSTLLFFSLRTEDGQNGEVDVGRNLDIPVQLEVFNVKRVSDIQIGDIDGDVLGDLIGQAEHFQFPRMICSMPPISTPTLLPVVTTGTMTLIFWSMVTS
jgi:hypothetical protein